MEEDATQQRTSCGASSQRAAGHFRMVVTVLMASRKLKSKAKGWFGLGDCKLLIGIGCNNDMGPCRK